MKKNMMLYSALVAIIGAILLIITIFTPYASAKDEYRDALMDNPDYDYSDEATMTNNRRIYNH